MHGCFCQCSLVLPERITLLVSYSHHFIYVSTRKLTFRFKKRVSHGDRSHTIDPSWSTFVLLSVCWFADRERDRERETTRGRQGERGRETECETEPVPKSNQVKPSQAEPVQSRAATPTHTHPHNHLPCKVKPKQMQSEASVGTQSPTTPEGNRSIRHEHTHTSNEEPHLIFGKCVPRKPVQLLIKEFQRGSSASLPSAHSSTPAVATCAFCAERQCHWKPPHTALHQDD